MIKDESVWLTFVVYRENRQKKYQTGQIQWSDHYTSSGNSDPCHCSIIIDKLQHVVKLISD